MRGAGTVGRALLLVLGLALSAWGLTATLPHATGSAPGYLAKSLYPVLMWALLAVACLAGLAYLAIRR